MSEVISLKFLIMEATLVSFYFIVWLLRFSYTVEVWKGVFYDQQNAPLRGIDSFLKVVCSSRS